ncbi:MAG TPA: hypothetical protein DF383_09120 [Deltaproteobacteria bacterium]|nr:hypothetical protein [Deltaproteobacteria bacterium]
MSIRSAMTSLALTLLRIGTGIIMATHGWLKLQNFSQTVENFAGMGIPKIGVYLAIAGELGGGLGLIFGLLTPLAAFGILCVMVTAIYNVHLSNGLLAKDGGFEYPMTLGLVALFFIFRGAGPISVDALFCRKKRDVVSS